MANDPKIVFTGDSTNAVAAVKRLNSELTSLQKVSAGVFSAGLGGWTAVATAALVATTRAAINHADALNEMSERTGMAVEDLSKLEYTAKLNGVAVESLAKGLTALSVSVAEAGTGAGPMADKYAKLGISVRNADGTMKTSRQILGELADAFKAMPDGVDKTNLAVDLFGKRLGSEMIPMLNLGAEGMKKLGDEAEALGVVIGSAFAKEAADFNDNLDRMRGLAESAGKSLGSYLVPALNKFMEKVIDAKKAGLSLSAGLEWFIPGGSGAGNLVADALGAYFDKPAEKLKEINSELERLKKLRANRAVQSESIPGLPPLSYYDDQIAAMEKLRKYYDLQAERETGDGVASAKELAAKREAIERQLQAKLAEIAKLRGVAEGKVSADILETDDKRVAAQIKNAEKVRDAMSAAWKSALKDAEAAGAAAAKLFDDAANTRASGVDRAAAKRRSALSPEDQQAEIQKEFDNAASAAESAAALARMAEFNGRTENAAKLALAAERAAEKAARLAEQIDDPEMGARAIEQAAEIQAQLQEAQARQKQAEQQAYQKQAETTAAQIAQLDEQITALQTKAAALKVEADIKQAEGQLAALQVQLDNIKDKTITVTVQQVNTGGAPLGGTNEGTPAPGFAYGGRLPGRAPHDRADNMLYWGTPGEWVIQRPAVRYYGADFIARLNAMQLPKYAYGGALGNLRIPSVAPRSSSQMAPAVFKIPGVGDVPVQMESGVMADFSTQLKRAALKRGGKR